MPRLLVLSVVVLALTLAACGDDDEPGGAREGSAPVRVVATTTHMGDLVRAIGGREVAVTQLLAPNADPHDHEPRPSDVSATAKAQVVVKSGGDLDAWVDEVAEQAGGSARVLDAGEGRPHVVAGAAHHEEDAHAEEGHEAEHHDDADAAADEADPHWWGDPRNVAHAARRVAAALAAADPARAATFRTAADRYVAALGRLDAALIGCVAQVPRRDRKLVTDHDAFATFAARYGFEVVGTVIPARTTQAQPSAGDLRRLARDVRAERVPVVFPERSLSPRLTRAIADATGARVGDALYADALGPGMTYLDAQRANVDAVVRGLTGGAHRCAAA